MPLIEGGPKKEVKISSEMAAVMETLTPRERAILETLIKRGGQDDPDGDEVRDGQSQVVPGHDSYLPGEAQAHNQEGMGQNQCDRAIGMVLFQKRKILKTLIVSPTQRLTIQVPFIQVVFCIPFLPGEDCRGKARRGVPAKN